jgi:cell division septation protein DedD
MNRSFRGVTGAIMIVASQVLLPTTALAQTTGGDAQVTMRMDSVFARARQFAAAGKHAEAHRIADSLLATIAPASNAYGDALYGRATIAATSDDAERDYRRIIVEYPLAAHSGDALLQLAQIETARGDRAAATAHLQRFWRENAGHPARATAGLSLARLLFDQNEPLRACGVLADAKAAAAENDIELRNQLNFSWGRCPTILAAARADSTARATAPADGGKTGRGAARPDPARGKPAAPAARDTVNRAGKAKYTVQVAAYPTRAEAQQLTDRLVKQALDAYMQGSQKPFRVRVGHYMTRAEATKAVTDLKKYGLTGFVTGITN